MNWSWLKSRFFWLNLIAIIILIVQYLIDNNSLPDYAKWEALFIVVLNAIAGMIQSNEVAKLKAKLKR
jgi:flagellar motor component MotA